MRRRQPSLAGILLATTIAGSPARAEAPVTRYLRGDGGARVTAALARADAARALLTHGTFAAAMRTLVDPGTVPAAAGPAGVRSSDLPPSVRVPIRTLSAAVSGASRALGHGDRTELRAAFRALVTSGPAPPQRGPSVGPGVPEPAHRRPDAILLPVSERRARATRLLPAHALAIAEALDVALPSLRGRAPRAARAAGGCDILDLSPHLCIASEADNTHLDAFELLIDFGGNDFYSGGAAAPFVDGSGTLRQVAVVVDLGGDDTYVGRKIDDELPLVVGQGHGNIGALGILVDTGGDDVYRSHATTVPGNPHAAVAAQGSGVAGIGTLFDLGGNDAYTTRAPAGVGDSILALGQGAAYGCAAYTYGTGGAGGCGAGGLFDSGEGDDAYLVDAGTATGPRVGEFETTNQPYRFAVGQGVAAGLPGGAAVLADDGGTDALTLRARASWINTDAYPYNPFGAEEFVRIPDTSVAGQGSAGAGVALLLMGDGDTTYTAEALSEGAAYNSLATQGHGVIGLAVLDDAGGDDSYRARATLAHERQIRIGDVCTQDVRCEAEVEIGMENPDNFAQVQYAQGWGLLGGTGIVRDRRGDDDYLHEQTQTVEVRVIDERTSGAPLRLHVDAYGSSWMFGQGAAQGYALGAVLDEAGDDDYASRATNRATAIAAASGDPSAPRVSARNRFESAMVAQGIGFGLGSQGALIDLGGADTFSARAHTTLETTPDSGLEYRRGIGAPLAQGDAALGNGVGIFVALGDRPALETSPVRGVCPFSPGLRGSTAWTTCPASSDFDPARQRYDWPPTADAGTGLVSRARSLSATTIELGPAPSSVDADAIPSLHARLRAGAIPIEGALVHFALEGRVGAVWYRALLGSAITDAHGVAAARLALFDQRPFGFGESTEWRFSSFFDGRADPALSPSFSVSAVEIDYP